MGTRRRGREAALQMLYQLEASAPPDPEGPSTAPLLQHVERLDIDRAFAAFFDNFDADENVHDQCRQLVNGVIEHIDEINDIIVAGAKTWKLPRMAMVDRNVCRIAVFELRFGAKLDKPIIIDEAVEVARRFGSERSAAFVNGVLDTIANADAEPS